MTHGGRGAVRRTRRRLGVPPGRLVLALAAAPLLALAGCTTPAATDGLHNEPGTNVTRSTGLDIADLRIATAGPQAAQDPYPAGADAVVLARISDASGAGDVLTSVSSPAADRAVLLGAAGRPVSSLTVPAARPLDLTLHGPRIELVGLHEALREGERVPLTLTFAHAGVVSVQVPRRIDTSGGAAPTPTT